MNNIFARPIHLNEQVLRVVMWVGMALSAAFVVVNLREQNWLTLTYNATLVGLLALALRQLRQHQHYWLVVLACCLAPAALVLLNLLSMPEKGHYWVFGTVMLFYYILPHDRAFQFNAVYVLIVLALLWQALDPAIAVRFFGALLLTSTIAFSLSQSIAEKNRRLEKLATEDALTGIANRRSLDQRVEAWLSLAARHPNGRAALVLIDLDHFKQVNDQYGHGVGDEVLRRFAGALQERVRGSDLLARYGGEEFALFMPGTDAGEAAKVLEELRLLIGSLAMPKGIALTFSAGISRHHSGDSLPQWLRRCDKALYQAKAAGRDCALCYGCE